MNQCRKAFIPPVKLSISEWAEQNITISSGNNRGMKYDSSFMPYQNEIMDCVNDPNIEKICITASARMGKTFVIQNILAYYMVHDPQSILYMRPIDNDIQKFSKEELASLILNTPKLKEIIDASKETYDHKIYPGGSLRLVGSNSPGKLKGYGVKICLLDEVDTYSAIAGYGNPLDLAEERTSEFSLYGRTIVMISTPTVKDTENKIDWLYENKSDKRVYVCPCLMCGHEQELYFRPREGKGGVHFDEYRKTNNPSDIYYECENCKCRINDSQRLTMMRKGRWIITRPEIKGFAGFKINRLYSPLATMESIVKDFLNKKDNVLMLRQFLNDALAEAWDENKQVKASTNELFQRREHYTSQVPYGVGILTMAVDVQGNENTDKCWLEYEVKGWGKDNENWVIEHDLIYGNPAEQEIWSNLMTKINQTYLTSSGNSLGITVCGIDTQGGFTREVQAFIKGKQRMLGLEGKKNSPNAPLISKRKNTSINSWEVGTNSAKDTIFSILSIDKHGPNYCHFPDTLDEEYFLSLLSEKKTEKMVGGVKVKKYEATRKRNEVLDLFVYNWYLYNHVQRYKPDLLAESLAYLNEVDQTQEQGRVAAQIHTDTTEAPQTPGSTQPTATATPQAPKQPGPTAIIQNPTPKRQPYRLPVMQPYRF